MAKLRSMLPPVYQPLFGPLFDGEKPNETRATCDRCAMADHGDPSPVTMEYFLNDAKCCTYFPQLPNYLVGAILADEDPAMDEGKRRIRERIKTRIGITPHWVTRPAKMTHIMQAYTAGFGRAASLRCPYFNVDNLDASCTIWKHRETICMTYHCKYVGGKRGYDFWTALKGYLAHVQRHLVRHAQRGVDTAVIEPVPPKGSLTLEDIEDLPPKATDYARWWGTWLGREEEFYLRCHDWVKNAKAEEFEHNVDGNAEGKLYMKELTTTYETQEQRILPKNLIRNVRMKEDHVGEKVVVTTYHRYDSFSLDKDLYDVCGMFRPSETLAENVARLKEEGIELAPELIEYLFAAGVLIEPAPKKESNPKAEAGELEGRKAALEAILNAREIYVSMPARQKIQAADVASLDEWIRKAANASNIVDVLGIEPADDLGSKAHPTELLTVTPPTPPTPPTTPPPTDSTTPTDPTTPTTPTT